MTIGKPLRCYPFRKKDSTYIYLPYDKTEFDLTFIGDDADMKPIQEYWESIQKPTYDPRKSVQENLTDLKNFMGYWPEPLNCDKIVQTALLEYEEDTPFVDMFKKQAAFELQQKEGDTKRVFRKKDWDDDVPF